MRNLISTTFCALLLAAVCTAAQADVYRWKDSRGNWQYGDNPPPGAERIGGPAKPQAARPPQTTPTPPPPAPATPRGDPAPVISRETEQRVRDDMAQQRVEQCKAATDNYNQSVRALRIYKTDEKGERIWLTPAEADAARLAARSDMDLACAK